MPFVCSIAEKKVPICRNISNKNRETFTYNFHNERHVWHLSDPAYEFVWWISWVMRNLNVLDCPPQRIPKDIVVHELFCPKFPLNAFRLLQQREYLILKLGFVTWIPHLRLNHSLENWKCKDIFLSKDMVYQKSNQNRLYTYNRDKEDKDPYK